MGTIHLLPIEPMTKDEKTFFKQFGARIAALRKEQGLTQQQLGELLEISQQQVASFEIGRRRVPLSLLPPLAHALAVAVEDLIGTEPKRAKRGPAPKLQQQLEQLSRLPKAKQRFVSDVIDSVLAQA